MAFSIITLSMRGSRDERPSITTLYHCCRVLFVVMLSVGMLNAAMLNVIILSVVAPP